MGFTIKTKKKRRQNSPCPLQTSPTPSSQAPPRNVQWCHDAASRNFLVPGDCQIIKIKLTTEIIGFFFFGQDNWSDQPPATYIVIHPSACLEVQKKLEMITIVA